MTFWLLRMCGILVGTYYCHVNNTVGEDTCHLEITGKAFFYSKYQSLKFRYNISFVLMTNYARLYRLTICQQ